MRSDFIDLTGQTFGKWTVLAYLGRFGNTKTGGPSVWACRCQCGNESKVQGQALKRGDSTQCRSCATSEQQTTHGQSRTDTYRIYHGMLQRCYNENHRLYHYYGGRGVVVCDRWREDFLAFHADMGGRPSGKHSIDRIDSNGPYAPENCRWATADQQARSKRSNRWLEHNGERMILKDWARRIGMHPNTLYGRIDGGWPIDRALSEPPNPRLSRTRCSQD